MFSVSLGLADLLSYVAMAFFAVNLLPQLLYNASNKCFGGGLSFGMFVLWLAGDLFNLLSILLKQNE